MNHASLMRFSGDPRVPKMALQLADAQRFALSDAGWQQDNPGLYAFWPKDRQARAWLGLTPEADQPLYVGVAPKTLRSRVAAYTDARFSGSREFRWGLIGVLHVVQNAWAPEGALLGRDPKQYAQFRKLTFSRAAVRQWHAWMHANLTVSTAYVANRVSAEPIEKGVIMLLEPLLNVSANSLFLNDPDGLRRFTHEAQARIERHARLTDALTEVDRAMRDPGAEDARARRRHIDVDLHALGLPTLAVPTDRDAVRAATHDALSRWLGAPYPDTEVDIVLDTLADSAWLPGAQAELMALCGLPVEPLVRLD